MDRKFQVISSNHPLMSIHYHPFHQLEFVHLNRHYIFPIWPIYWQQETKIQLESNKKFSFQSIR